MKKKSYLKLLIVFVILGGGVYWYYNSIAIWGTSANGMWKATYKKNQDQYVERGWTGKIKQKSGKKVNVEDITFSDNNHTLMSVGDFEEGESEDGEVTVLYPFSAEFYGGDEPKKGHIYKVHVTWKDKGKSHTDSFQLK
ncbi:hypothetical protein [Priestia megaterium]|uniref:hypothetical protein n=1 Tax=Priestia megaterium TaxID=1404 RepID=UPI000BFD4BAC|nr:hypothetical protein [Priestia megaterium]PGY48730.1 hypothetical protein COE35_25005 [Priestia megaterium]PNE08706.1 hypothetical protein C1Y47_03950 [Priestia megaterium]WJD83299.1 hypothetical protein QRD24_12620 [Priestia megaterium]